MASVVVTGGVGGGPGGGTGGGTGGGPRQQPGGGPVPPGTIRYERESKATFNVPRSRKLT